METKEQLTTAIREWVKIDNELRALSKEQTKRKNDKKRISAALIEIMKKNEIDAFDIKDGELRYTKKNIKKPITKKILLNILSTYYSGDVSKATELNNYIIENREEVTREYIEIKKKE
jgi:Family of unknown function (DUF5760)